MLQLGGVRSPLTEVKIEKAVRGGIYGGYREVVSEVGGGNEEQGF